MAKRTYKTMFKQVKWEKYYIKESPISEIYIDGDSLAFRHILNYIDSLKEEDYNLKASVMNNIDTDTLIRRTCLDVAKYSISIFEKVEEILKANKIKYTIVFGEGYVERKKKIIEERREKKSLAYIELIKEKGKISRMRNEIVVTKLYKYLVFAMEEVLDIVKKSIDEYLTVAEPDIYCPSKCPVVMSEDYDLFLFGAEYLVKSINEEEVIFISKDTLLESLELENVEQLVIAAVLCGTDYNEGVKGIGPVKSKIIAKKSPYDEIVDREVVNFFLCSGIRENTTPWKKY
jgi:hypothetical protein